MDGVAQELQHLQGTEQATDSLEWLARRLKSVNGPPWARRPQEARTRHPSELQAARAVLDCGDYGRSSSVWLRPRRIKQGGPRYGNRISAEYPPKTGQATEETNDRKAVQEPRRMNVAGGPHADKPRLRRGSSNATFGRFGNIPLPQSPQLLLRCAAMHPTDRPALAVAPCAPLPVPDGFADRLKAIDVQLDVSVLAALGDYLARLLAMNEHMNLTAIVEPHDAWVKHALDALTLLPFLRELPAGASLADVGSGGGVPGIPLALARRDLLVTLIEATQKKAAFLADVARDLGLEHVTVRAERAETLGRDELRGAFDVVTARAVSKLNVLVPIAASLVQRGGLLLLVKGQRADEELAAAGKVLKQEGLVHEKTVVTPTGRIVVLRRVR